MVWVVGLVLVAGACGYALFRPAPASHYVDDDIDDASPPAPGYVGPQACAPCHAARTADFLKTNHARACRLPDGDGMPAGFAVGLGGFTPRNSAIRFEMTRSGNDFFQTSIRPTPFGAERSTSRIGLVYGAGKLDEVFFTWHDDYLFELPVTWLHPQNAWGSVSFHQLSQGDFSRTTTPRCMECHNTWFHHIAGTENKYEPQSFLLGVSCERCHGPGRDHIALHEGHPVAGKSTLLVHPGKLSRERQIEVCTQCHGNALRHRTPEFSYRPGEPLDTHFRTAITEFPEQDHVANQVKYLRQSKCFQKAEKMSCVTCHDPHQPTDVAAVQQSCLKCHQPAACVERPRLPAAVRDDCVACHMPKQFWMNVHFHTEDDVFLPPIRRSAHKIAVYPAARDEVLLAWNRGKDDAASKQEAARLTADLSRHWLAEEAKLRREYRFLAAIGAAREAVRLNPTPATREVLERDLAKLAAINAELTTAIERVAEKKYPEAETALLHLLAAQPKNSVALGKLGTVYANLKQDEQAVRYLQAAADADPDDPYGYTMLGWLAYLRGAAAESVEYYRRAAEIDPESAQINYQAGLSLIKLEGYEEAAAALRRTLVIDPNHAGACQALCQSLREIGKTGEAVRYGRKAARLTESKNPDVLLTLADAYASAGRYADAREAADRALPLAEANSPDLADQLRGRLALWKSRAEKVKR